MRNSKALVFPAIMAAILAVLLAAGPVIGSAQQFTDEFRLDGVVSPTGCRVGAVLSTDQFTTTGFSSVRFGGPNSEAVAGAWVVADNTVKDTGVVFSNNCNPDVAARDDDKALNVIGMRIMPTAVSAKQADIEQVKLIQDVNLNGTYEPLIDIQVGQQPGSALDSQSGAVFHYGPQQPIVTLGDPEGKCEIVQQQVAQTTSAEVEKGKIFKHTQTHEAEIKQPCAAGFLAVVDVGGKPKTGSQFGLQLETMAADIPAPSKSQRNVADFSSGFNSSQNPQASNVRLTILGGTASSETPISHVSNGSGGPESAARSITFSGGQTGEGLLTRFRKDKVTPGTREAIVGAAGVCDGGELANTNASILPSIAGAPPTIAGGLGSLPCIASSGTDEVLTGINGAVLVFDGPNAKNMGTVRMYVDGNANGILFEPGELTQQVTPVYNEETGEAIAVFGPTNGQILTTGNGTPVAGGAVAGSPGTIGQAGGGGGASKPADAPLLIVFTADVDQSATSGDVPVKIGLQSFDDTAQAKNVTRNPCNHPGFTAPGRPSFAGAPGHAACGSNFLNDGPIKASFTIQGAGGGQQPDTGVAQYDTNNNGVIDDSEFMTAIDEWVAASIDDSLFFDVLNAWVEQSNVSSSNVTSLSLNSVALSNDGGNMTFAVSGQGISSTQVEVIDLSGETVFTGQAAGNTLTWSKTNDSGQPLANGTYLYRVTVRGADGETISSDIKKLVVLR